MTLIPLHTKETAPEQSKPILERYEKNIRNDPESVPIVRAQSGRSQGHRRPARWTRKEPRRQNPRTHPHHDCRTGQTVVPFDGVLVEASLQHEAKATAKCVPTLVVLHKQRRHEARHLTPPPGDVDFTVGVPLVMPGPDRMAGAVRHR
jgi:hypothetical protein